MAAVDWGSVPAWIGLGGVVIAAASLWATRRDTKRSSASGAYVLATLFRVGNDEPFTKARVVNDGPGPIHAVRMSLWTWGTRRWWWRFRKPARWMTGTELFGNARTFHVIRAQSASEEADLDGLPIGPPGTLVPPMVLRFRDQFGRWWVRWPDGRLNRLWWRR